MKKSIFLLTIILQAFSAHAENSIIGKWKDKNDPAAHQFEFKVGNDFIYVNKWSYEGQRKSKQSVGVWEIGAWTITSPNGVERSCSLTIYADTKECCFEFKFLANNLILTNKYNSSGYGSMCENRVLIKDE
jgi:hypothetical protein